jgi:hypothetical protein
MTTPELPGREPTQPFAPLRPEQGASPVHSAPATTRKPARKTIRAAAVGFTVGVVLGVAGTVIASSVAGANAFTGTEKPGTLKYATTSCALSNNLGAKLGDNDTSLSLNGKGSKDTSGLSAMEFDCAIDTIKVPDYVRAQMEKTRALDGTQRETWGNISATWSYHPDSGLDVGLKEK